MFFNLVHKTGYILCLIKMCLFLQRSVHFKTIKYDKETYLFILYKTVVHPWKYKRIHNVFLFHRYKTNY